MNGRDAGEFSNVGGATLFGELWKMGGVVYHVAATLLVLPSETLISAGYVGVSWKGRSQNWGSFSVCIIIVITSMLSPADDLSMSTSMV